MNAISAYVTTMLFVVSDRFAKREKGATAVEYGLLVALIAAVIITAVALFGGNLSNLFQKVATTVNRP